MLNLGRVMVFSMGQQMECKLVLRMKTLFARRMELRTAFCKKHVSGQC